MVKAKPIILDFSSRFVYMRAKFGLRKFIFAPVMAAIMVGLCCIYAPAQVDSAASFAPSGRQQEEYQNLQRAFSLSTLKSDIKQLDDAPQRCFLRVQIMEFIFTRRVRGYYDTARGFGTDCLDDIARYPGQFTDAMADEWRANIAALLKNNLSDDELRADGRPLPAEEEIDLSNLENLDLIKNSNAVAAKAAGRLWRGDFDFDLRALAERLREVNPAAANLVLSAALNSAPLGENLDDVAERFTYLSALYLDPETPFELKARYLRFAMQLADSTLRQPGNIALFKLTRDILRECLLFVREILPRDYARTLIQYATLNSKTNAAEIEAEDAFERIRASKNKLAQTISEAEGAKSKNLKNSLLRTAARMALREKRFRPAVDLVTRIDADHPSLVLFRSRFLSQDVLIAALRENDLESALYALRKAENFIERGRGLVRIADKAIELGEKQEALDRLYEAVQNLDRAENGVLKACAMLAAVPAALKIDRAKAFDIATDAIRIVNRLPSPAIDDKPGTTARLKYSRDVLQDVSEHLRYAFELLARENLALADPTAQALQLKEFRLAAQIALETQRPYTIPAESEKPLRVLKSKFPAMPN